MKKPCLTLALAIILTMPVLYAQSDVDALRFSLTQNVGTARNMALGNTMGSIGADISVMNTNPAGLAKISQTEFSLTPGFYSFHSTSEYIGELAEDSRFKFNVPNVGMVFLPKFARSENPDGWSGMKFGFAFNRLANFNQAYTINGYNADNSLADYYYEVLRDNTSNTFEAENNFPFGASLAYNTDLVYFDTADLRYYTSVNANVQQDIRIARKGGLDEGALSVAGAFRDKLYLGATIGIPVLNYTEQVRHTETDERDSSFSFNYFEQNYTYQSSGAGVNAKFGLLAQPHKSLRVSLALHTPSLVFVNDAYLASIFADYETYTAEALSPDGEVDYRIRLPWRLLSGVTYIHKFGLVTAEYELSDPGSARYNFQDATSDILQYEREVNDAIADKYRPYHTLKLGVEIKADPMRIRAGFQYRSSPFKPDFEPLEDRSDAFTYSAGIGYRGKHWYLDAAYQFSRSTDIYVPYVLSSEAVSYATLDNKVSLVTFTLGFRFGG